MFHRTPRHGAIAVVLAAGLTSPFAVAQDAAAASGFSSVQQRGVDYLLGQQKDGVFEHKGEPQLGVTALALGAVLTKPAGERSAAEKEFVEAAAKFVLSQQNDDGSFGKSITNYQTSAAMLALARLGGERVKEPMRKAQKFLLGVQNMESNGIESSHKDYGGFGYGPGSRGDMSNTQFAIEALHASGLDAGHEAFVRAISFLQRTQNLRAVNDFRSETVDGETEEKHPVEPGDDGGAVYLPGNSKFGFDAITDGVRVPRSYGSMTYALLKTYALCGLKQDDPRMQAATKWIRRNWALDRNPGSYGGLDDNARYQGLFYYYETMARSLTICGIDEVETLGKEPKKVAWREALAAHLAKIQREDGSWLNTGNGRWWEDQPAMCTIYALIALADCHAGHDH